MGVGERGGGRERERQGERKNGNINWGKSSSVFWGLSQTVHSQKVITAKAGARVPRSACYQVWTGTFVLRCLRHNQNLQINYIFIVLW